MRLSTKLLTETNSLLLTYGIQNSVLAFQLVAKQIDDLINHKDMIIEHCGTIDSGNRITSTLNEAKVDIELLLK